MTMSEGTAATTLSATSSGAGFVSRSSVGGAAPRSSLSGSRRDSLGATSTGSGGAGARAPRTSLSRTESAGSKTAMARMEQRGGTGSGSVVSATSSASDADLRHSHYKEGIRLAEMGDWPVLVRRLPREPQLARHKDHHGMLPLHWACTEDDAGPAVVRALLEAFPEGVITRNNAQYLPIHIAVRAGLPNDTLELLCDARPSSLLEETPAGKTPLMLAIEASLPASTVNLLRRAQQNYEDPSEDNDDDRHIEDAKRAIEVQSHLLRESMMLGASNAMSFVGARPAGSNNNNNQSSLTVGRLQSNSVLGAFPAEARSSMAWADRRGGGATSSVSNQSFAATTNTNLSSTRSLPAVPSSSSVSSASSTNNTAVVRYMDTLMPDKPSDYMIDEEHELMGRYTTDEEHLPPRSFLANPGSQSLGGFPLTNPAGSTPQPRPTHLRATEGDLSGFNSGVCGVCYKKFSMFRKKYQCKSCWMVVCKKHVAAKIELPGHKKKRSVCADCNILHQDGGNVLPSVPGHSSAGGPTFAHTHPGTYSVISTAGNNQQNHSTAIVPTRGHRADSTPYKSGNHVGGGSVRASAMSNASELRHTVAAAPSRPSGSVRFAPAPPSNASASANNNNNSMALVQKPAPAPRGGALDRFGSDTTASLTETDRSSAEVTAMSHRITTLEEQNKMLLSRLADQEKQYDDCMLLLTQTMTRVAEIEMRLPGLRLNATGSERESDAELNPASFDFGYPMSGAYGSYAIK